jgi:hypothetical protein
MLPNFDLYDERRFKSAGPEPLAIFPCTSLAKIHPWLPQLSIGCTSLWKKDGVSWNGTEACIDFHINIPSGSLAAGNGLGAGCDIIIANYNVNVVGSKLSLFGWSIESYCTLTKN